MKNKLKFNDYQLLFDGNRKVYAKYFVFYYRPFEQLVFKTAVKKKVGKAVTRNYYKRRLRNILWRILYSNNCQHLFILAVSIRKHSLNFNEEYKLISESIQPILSSHKHICGCKLETGETIN